MSTDRYAFTTREWCQATFWIGAAIVEKLLLVLVSVVYVAVIVLAVRDLIR